MIIDINWKEISSFTYYFTRRNNLTINTQVGLKDIWRWRNFYNVVTIACIIISIDSTMSSLHKIFIGYSFINVFVLLFICYIVNKIHYNSVIVVTKNLRVIEILYSTISSLINCFFDFWILEKIYYSCAIMATLWNSYNCNNTQTLFYFINNDNILEYPCFHMEII